MTEALLEAKNISKSFGETKALQSVSLKIYENEILGVVGENGSGKSTLMKILVGLHKQDEGQIFLYGNPIIFKNPNDAYSNGVCMVFQEQSLLPNLMAYENMFLGKENRFSNKWTISTRMMLKAAKAEFEEFNLDIDPTSYVGNLSIIERQMLEIIRNIWISKISGAKMPVIILDEPTSVFSEKDISFLFEKLKELKQKMSIIFISHRLREIIDICDRIYILKDGKNEGCYKKIQASEEIIRSKMVGHKINSEYYFIDDQRNVDKRIILELQNCNKKNKFKDISFKLYKGEILSICGSVGSGKEELCNAIYGLNRFDSGIVAIEGKKVSISSPRIAFKNGIGFLPEDRRTQGLFLEMPVFDNITINILKGIINEKKQVNVAENIIKKLAIKVPSAKSICKTLSGGNQQKVVLAKWILSSVKILIMSYPTRGVDIGAKQEIYKLIRNLAKRGISMIIMGDTLEEDIGLANRIIVMKDGVIKAVIESTIKKPTPADLIKYIV